MRDFFFELQHDFGRDPCVLCVLRRMPCSGCASAAAQAIVGEVRLVKIVDHSSAKGERVA